MPPSTIELEKLASSNGSAAIYQTKGKLSLETVNEFIQTMRQEPAQHLILDLSGIIFLDSAGVGSLVSLYVNRRSHAKTLALAGLSAQAAAVVTVAGLQKLLPIFRTVEEAAAKES